MIEVNDLKERALIVAREAREAHVDANRRLVSSLADFAKLLPREAS